MIDKNILDIIFTPDTNQINIEYGGECQQQIDVEIYTDNELLWKIENDTLTSHGTRWHRPNKNLLYFKKLTVKVLTDEVNDKKHVDIDPYGEEEWTEKSIILEKTWDINTSINIKEHIE